MTREGPISPYFNITFVLLLTFVWKFFKFTQFVHRKKKHFLGTHKHKLVGTNRANCSCPFRFTFLHPPFCELEFTNTNWFKKKKQNLESHSKNLQQIWQARNISFTTKHMKQKLLYNMRIFYESMVHARCILALLKDLP